MSDSVRILFALRGGFGLGDVTQFSVVLKHLRKHRPHWKITVQSPRGSHSALHGQCEKSLHFDEDRGEQDEVHEMELDNASFDKFTDRPSNKTTRLLRRTFGLEWEAELGRYEVRASGPAMRRAGKWLEALPNRPVVLQYEGGSSKSSKDLHAWQAEAICSMILKSGHTPVVLDFNRGSPVVDQKTVFSPVVGKGDIWGEFGAGDAETIAALIRQSVAFVGIDSGPGKIASSTDTPSLICWLKHHPLQYHDPAPNTMHLIPEGWPHRGPLDGDPEMIAYFRSAYQSFDYQGEHGLVAQASFWLCRTLGLPVEAAAVDFVVPNSLCSAAICASKMRFLAQQRPINVIVAGKAAECVETVQWLRRFEWIRSVRHEPICLYQGPEMPQNTRGHVLYVSDGVRGGRHYLVPDAILAQGKAAEEWMPDVPADPTVEKMPCQT